MGAPSTQRTPSRSLTRCTPGVSRSSEAETTWRPASKIRLPDENVTMFETSSQLVRSRPEHVETAGVTFLGASNSGGEGGSLLESSSSSQIWRTVVEFYDNWTTESTLPAGSVNQTMERPGPR